MNTNNLETFFKNSLKNNNFLNSKKSNTFYKKTTDITYFVINMQKSRYDDSFYFNVGITYDSLQKLSDWDSNIPLWDETHTHSRAEMYIGDYNNKLQNLMSKGVQNSCNDIIKEEVFNFIIDFFEQNSTVCKFKANYKKYYLLDNVAISSYLRKYCEN